MKKLLVVGLVLLMAGFAMATDTPQYRLLIPAELGTILSADSLYATHASTSKSMNLEREVLADHVAKIYLAFSTVTQDADIDSVDIIVRGSQEGITWVTFDSVALVIAGSATAGNSCKLPLTVDSAAFNQKYFQVLAKIWGDNSGSTAQYMRISSTMTFADGTGQIIGIKRWPDTWCVYQE